MKQTLTLLLLGILCFGTNASAQSCTSPASNYDLIVVSNVVIPPQPAGPNYIQGYVCNGGNLLDSSWCCTRMVNIDSGGYMAVGPNSYGMVYIKSGGTFNGNNVSNNWNLYAEAGANIVNHSGTIANCSQVIFTNSNCIMGFSHTESPKPNVSVVDHTLNFAFTSAVSDVTIEVFDVSGNVVRSEQVNQTSVHSMNLNGLASGIYMYRVMQGAEIISSDKIVLP